MEQQDSKFLDSQWVRDSKEAASLRKREVAAWVLLSFVVLVALAVIALV